MRVGFSGIATAIGASLLVTGCGSGPATSSSATSAAAGASSTSASPSTDPNAGLRAGAQLKAYLPAVADLPKGFHVPAGGPQDSGAGFGADLPATTLSHPDCQHMESSTAWVSQLGQAAAFAQTEFDNSYGDQVFPEVDAYRGTEAKSVMAAYRKLFSSCRTFTYTESGRHAKVSLVVKPGPKVGDESIQAVLTSPTFEGGTTLVAVRVGQLVLTVDYNTTAKNLGTAAAAKLATAMASKL